MLAALACSQVPRSANAQTVATPELHAVRATTPPRIDGVLDDAAWADEAMPLDPWLSYNPLRGERAKRLAKNSYVP